MQQLDSKYLALDDGRNLCSDCLDSAIMDTQDCQPLYREIQEFFKGLRMKVEQQIPLLLVETQGHHFMLETSGLYLSEEQTVSTVRALSMTLASYINPCSRFPTYSYFHAKSQVLRWPRFGKYLIIDMFTDLYRLIPRCEIRAILILCGLPRLVTGSILAHEMMHAWLRLNGYHNLSPVVEEGICQVLSYLWLDSEIMVGLGSTSSVASSSPSSSSKKGKHSQFEQKLAEFSKNQIPLQPIEMDLKKVEGQYLSLG